MSIISIENIGTIDIGRQGENLARVIEFDVSSLVATWPDAVITLLVKRKRDMEPYFADVTVKDGVLRWPITSTETSIVGDGKMEIQAVYGDVVAKSVTGVFRVTNSLSGSASTVLPEVHPSWVDRLLAAAGNLSGSQIAAPGTPHQQLVSDENGKAVWQEQLAYRHVEQGKFVILPEALLPSDDDSGDGIDDTFLITNPWEIAPVAGQRYQVSYNGVVYECDAIPYTPEDVPEGCVVLGDATLTGLEGGNPEAPFAFICVPNEIATAMGMPIYGMGVVSDGATAVTLEITFIGKISTVKTIDDEFLPDNVKRSFITIEIASDGTISSDVPFADAWKLSAAQLQSALAIKETSVYKGETYASVEGVSKCSGALGGYVSDFITIRFRKGWLDISDSSDHDTLRVLQWNATGFNIMARFAELPYFDNGGATYEGGYLRYLGNNNWAVSTIDELKVALGLS